MSLSSKTPKCKLCGGPHYKTFCFQNRKAIASPRKPIVRKPIQYSTKPRKPLKRTRIASQSKSERPVLVRRCDRAFSVFIRRRGSIGGKNRCFTCGKVMPWRDLQNGHYISRRKMITRFDETNCNPQCPRCNVDLGGNLKVYRERLVEKYGETAILLLEVKGHRGGRITTSELTHLVHHYEDRIKNMLDS